MKVSNQSRSIYDHYGLFKEYILLQLTLKCTLKCAHCIVEAGMAFLLFNRHISVAREQEGLKRKLERYYGTLLQKYVLLASSSIISVVGLFLTASTLYTALYLFMLLFLSIHRPTVYRIARDLKLQGEEKEIVVHKRDIPEE